MAGYSKFFVANKLSLAGKVFYKLKSLSKLKIGIGQIDNLVFTSQVTIRSGDLLPTYFKCTQKQSGVQYYVDCIISNNLVAQQNKSFRGNNNNFLPFEEGNIPVIFFHNLWGRIDTLVEHYWLLLRSRRQGKIFAYDPILQTSGTVEIVREGSAPETIEVDGKKVRAHHFKIIGFGGKVLFDIWTDQWRNILKMEEPGGGITFELTHSNVVKELNEAKGVDMWKNRVARSNIFFPNARAINFLKAEINAHGRGLSTETQESPGRKQSFLGDFEDGKLEGIFIIRSKKVKIEKPMSFPIKGQLPEDVEKYTNEEMGIESKDNKIHNKALEVAWKSETVWASAIKINLWVKENIPLGISLPSARMTLANGQGNSESKALLAIAMARSIGIPARRSGGIVFSAGNFIPHYWYEVWTGPVSGWVPLDPSTGEAGNIGATHIKLFSDGDLWNLGVKVLEFSPRPPERLTYINRELTWPVGEERTYIVKNGDKKIGEETALMEEVTILGDIETYKMKFHTNLDIQGREVEASAAYWMTPEGLPVKYQKEVRSGDREEKQEFLLEGKMMIQDVKGYRGAFKREIPFSRGAYFADTHFLSQWALIGGQFYDVKIGKSYRIYAFVPEALSVESITATVKKFESAEAGEKIYDCFRVETNKGIVFWLEKGNNRVVKVSFKIQGIDVELVKTKLKI